MIPDEKEPARELDWQDCSALIVGIMLGTGIFTVFPTLAAQHNPSVLLILSAWVIGTGVALLGALCFAELAGIFPQSGGDYGFLREAYASHSGNPVSFLFAWAQILVIRPASLVSLAIVLGVNSHVLVARFYEWAYRVPLPPRTSDLLQTLMTCGTLAFFTAVSHAEIRTS